MMSNVVRSIRQTYTANRQDGQTAGSLLEMTFCKECTHPITRPRIRFDSEGVCNGCLRAREKKGIDWAAKEQEFHALAHQVIAESPEREYDAIVPVSGGKDSTFQTWHATNKLGLRVLCVNIQPFLPTEVGAHNLRNIPERLPVDLVSVTPNMKIYAYLARLGMERFGDPYISFMYGVWAHVARIAVEKKIPLILYGENGEREYGGSTAKEYVDLDHTGVEARLRSDKRGWLPPERWTEYGLTPAQARFYQQPTEAEMAAIGLQRLFYSDYTPWSNNHHLHVALNVVGGFQTSDKRAPGTFTYGYSTDDDLYDVYIWMLWPKFGFGRATKYTSKDIQEGKISRSKAIELVRDDDGEFPWRAFVRFCEQTGMPEADLWNAIERSVGDEENLEREAREHGTPMKIPAWTRIGPRKWRLRNTIHGQERILELPIPGPRPNV
jgi:N-acetyl sugar amidotransferase